MNFPLIQFSQSLINAEIEPITIHVTFLPEIICLCIIVENCRYPSENCFLCMHTIFFGGRKLGLGGNHFMMIIDNKLFNRVINKLFISRSEIQARLDAWLNQPTIVYL